jgi:hypothetical protein
MVRKQSVFELFRAANGCWCVRRTDGLVYGEFTQREAALRFVRLERGAAMVPKPL